jgi:hypothetical protein
MRRRAGLGPLMAGRSRWRTLSAVHSATSSSRPKRASGECPLAGALIRYSHAKSFCFYSASKNAWFCPDSL